MAYMTEPDWSKAPADATHFIAENDNDWACWLKEVEDEGRGLMMRADKPIGQWEGPYYFSEDAYVIPRSIEQGENSWLDTLAS